MKEELTKFSQNIILSHSKNECEDCENIVTAPSLQTELCHGDDPVEDMEQLRTRVRPLEHSDTKGAVFISCTNREVEKLNKLRLSQISSDLVVIEAVNIHDTIKATNRKKRGC